MAARSTGDDETAGEGADERLLEKVASKRLSVRLDPDLLAELYGVVDFLRRSQDPEATISSVVFDALVHEIDRLRDELNSGERFPSPALNRIRDRRPRRRTRRSGA